MPFTWNVLQGPGLSTNFLLHAPEGWVGDRA